jgi:RimJ/RimL family protein N-acetyltransferase
VIFRPLVPSDLPTLHDWLGRPHVSEWWGPSPPPTEVQEDYLPLTETGSTTRGYIALLDGEPIDFIQSYVVLGSGDGWWEGETDPGARGIDQFLANEEQLGQGLGSIMVRAFVDQLFLDPAVTKVQTDPSPENQRAIRSYLRAGFLPHGEVITPDGPALLMLRYRSGSGST